MRRRPPPTKRDLRIAGTALLGLTCATLAVLPAGGCANPPLQRIPSGEQPLNNELEIRGSVCASPPSDAVFPIKILFLVDTSGSLIVTDPADVRVAAITKVIQKYQGLPGVEFAVVSFSSAIVNLTNGFTNMPDIATISQVLSDADDLTDDQGALGAAYEMLTSDMLSSTPADRARTKYIINLFTDGVPDPVCSADTTTCGTLTCNPGKHCNPTTSLSASNQMTESYECATDYQICSVPKMNWATAFNPPLNPALYPQLMAGANYNTLPQLLSAVQQIMALQTQYHVGSIELNTDFLFPLAALSNPLAQPFDLDRPAAEGLLQALAAAGNGTFQEFTSDSAINFLNVNYSAIQVQNEVVATFTSNQNAAEIGTGLVLDTDADGLTDAQEQSYGTCASSASCMTPWDTDGDGYSDFIEVRYEDNGFDPLDPMKPATPCSPIDVDSDGDGLMDCEETFLKTDPMNPDTDGDFLSDLTEVRNGMNPLDPTDAHGDINKDGILNLPEIEDGLSPTAQIAVGERQFSFVSTLTPVPPSTDAMATGSTCYQFDVQHIRLLTTGKTPIGPQGGNRIYYDVYETAADSPTNLSTVLRACADVLYDNGKFKAPLSGVVDFSNSDFVDLEHFNPTMHCKDPTAGLKLDAGIEKDGGGEGGATGGGG